MCGALECMHQGKHNSSTSVLILASCQHARKAWSSGSLGPSVMHTQQEQAWIRTASSKFTVWCYKLGGRKQEAGSRKQAAFILSRNSQVEELNKRLTGEIGFCDVKPLNWKTMHLRRKLALLPQPLLRSYFHSVVVYFKCTQTFDMAKASEDP